MGLYIDTETGATVTIDELRRGYDEYIASGDDTGGDFTDWVNYQILTHAIEEA